MAGRSRGTGGLSGERAGAGLGGEGRGGEEVGASGEKESGLPKSGLEGRGSRGSRRPRRGVIGVRGVPRGRAQGVPREGRRLRARPGGASLGEGPPGTGAPVPDAASTHVHRQLLVRGRARTPPAGPAEPATPGAAARLRHVGPGAAPPPPGGLVRLRGPAPGRGLGAGAGPGVKLTAKLTAPGVKPTRPSLQLTTLKLTSVKLTEFRVTQSLRGARGLFGDFVGWLLVGAGPHLAALRGYSRL